MPAKPEGHSTVSVYMMAFEAPRIVRFMEAVFGGKVILRFDREDGTLMHASVRIGDSVVMISDGKDDAPSFPVWLHVYVDDVDATYAKALEHGATSVSEPADQPDGDRRAGVKDTSGNTWWIGAPVS
jgi:uncharacterized glyoxalase superfamily protein PhnB